MKNAHIAAALLLTARDAAQRLAVCEKTLWNLSQPRGPIPVVRIGRAVRYAVADLELFIRDQTTWADSHPHQEP
jgi:hypothetical protein